MPTFNRIFGKKPSLASKRSSKNKATQKNQSQQERKKKCDEKPLDVIIIGAGWAGLGAAKYVQSQSNKSFLILEARDIIGGRSRTITMSDGITPAEIGSENIHGIDDNPLFSITKDAGIKYAVHKEIVAVYATDETVDETPSASPPPPSTQSSSNVVRRVPYSRVRELRNEFWSGRGKFEAFLRKRRKKDTDGEKGETSLFDMAEKYARKKDMTKRERRIFDFMLHGNIVADYGGDLSELSSKWWDAGKWTVGDDVYLATKAGEGFSAVVRHYAESVMSEIQLNSAVRAIDYSDSIATIHYEDLSDKTSSTPTMKKMEAQKVIITVPLGVLQARAITFTPPLPPSKQKSIDELGNGALTKCILLWNDDTEIFWPKDAEWITMIAADDDADGDASTNDRRRGDRWAEFYSPYHCNGGRPMLVAYAAGSESRRVETMTDDEVTTEVLASLRSIFNKNASSRDVVPEPKEALVTRWGTDDYSRGAYSFYKVGSSPRSRSELGRCVEGTLFFAGEATDLDNPQTVHGALASGIRAAREIVDGLIY